MLLGFHDLSLHLDFVAVVRVQLRVVLLVTDFALEVFLESFVGLSLSQQSLLPGLLDNINGAESSSISACRFIIDLSSLAVSNVILLDSMLEASHHITLCPSLSFLLWLEEGLNPGVSNLNTILNIRCSI